MRSVIKRVMWTCRAVCADVRSRWRETAATGQRSPSIEMLRREPWFSSMAQALPSAMPDAMTSVLELVSLLQTPDGGRKVCERLDRDIAPTIRDIPDAHLIGVHRVGYVNFVFGMVVAETAHRLSRDFSFGDGAGPMRH
jgi:hypothetical protein